jgi:hypothetical protein
VTGRGVHDDGVRCFVADLVARDERSDWISLDNFRDGKPKIVLAFQKGRREESKGPGSWNFLLFSALPEKDPGEGLAAQDVCAT